jgi:ribose 5-phosphate isomerase B
MIQHISSPSLKTGCNTFRILEKGEHEVHRMKIAVGSDEKTYLTDFVVEELRKRGIEVELHGPLKGENLGWTDVARDVSERVSEGACDQGILFCWTGTGVSIAANKVPGIRAALCQDARTAEGARKWNDANVLAMSLRSTSPVVAKEMLDAWLSTGPDENEKNNIDKVSELEKKYCR